MKKILLGISFSLSVLLCGYGSTFAQVTPGGGVSPVPPITPNDCVKWVNSYSIGDAGAACGSGSGGVSSFNTRTGAVTLSSGDVTTALGFTPGQGTVTSILGGNGILPSTNPCTATCTLNTTVTNNAQTGTSYATLATDGGSIVSGANSSAKTYTLPVATTTGYTVGFGLDYYDIGAGGLTITATTSIFDNGLTSVVLATGQDVFVWSDGANYHAMVSLPVMAAGTLLGNFSGSSNYPTAQALGTGVATALGANVSGTGAICLASGSACASGGSGLTVGTTTITSGTNGSFEFNNAGVLGELAATGSGNLVRATSFGTITGSAVTVTGNISAAGGSTGNIIVGASGGIEWNGRDAIVSINGTQIQFGSTDVASPLGQTLSVQSVSAGTSNVAGVNTLLDVSRGTGSGVGGNFTIQGAPHGAAATVQNTFVPIFALNGDTGLLTLPLITSDSGLTDATVCEDTTAHGLHAGSGTLGICLGTSSARYKHGITELAPGLTEVLALRPKSFYLNKGHGDPTKQMYGFIAEDMVKVLPRLVGLDKKGQPNTADYLGLVPVLVQAIQQQQVEIAVLQKQIAVKRR